MMHTYFRRIKPMLILMFLMLLMISSAVTVTPVSADSIVVNSNLDVEANDGVCTLREAIKAANTDTESGSEPGECPAGSGADTISLPAGTYTLTVQLPLINSEITIMGEDAETTIIQASACNPITTPGSCTPANYRIFLIGNPSGNLTLNSVTIRHGKTDNYGGGIYNDGGTMHIINSMITANKAEYGGGIFNYDSSDLTITNSIFKLNKVTSFGGAIMNYSEVTITNSSLLSNEAGSNGGGIFNYRNGTMTVTGTTFEDNSSNNGGGIRNYGIVTIANSTFSENRALKFGGAIFSDVYSTDYPETMYITNVTISGNSANEGGGLYIGENSTLNYANTIIANSTAGGDCYKSTTGIIGDNLHNLVEDGSCDTGASGFLSGDPKLGDLDDNGGPTHTHALLEGSPAIDAGDPDTCAAAPVSNVDQRGVPRPQDGDADGLAVCDIGAYELMLPVEPDFMLFLPLIVR